MQKLISGTCAAPAGISMQWDFTYDGDGTRVRQIVSTYDQTTQSLTGIAITAYFMGGAYEVTTDANNIALSTKKYYSIAGMTVAMNDGSGLQYLLTDHLGSLVAVTDSNGTLTSQQRYLPFGQVRADVTTPNASPTDFSYTGQRSLSMGLMDYKFRFYDDVLMRFVSPDSIVSNPANPQSMNRYSYVHNDPIVLTDPTGHCSQSGDDWCFQKDGHVVGDSWWHDNNGACSVNLTCNLALETYVRAGINYHATGPGHLENRWVKNNIMHGDEYDSIGPAQVPDIEMQKPYGENIKDPATGKIRKTGLGLRDGPCDSGCWMDQDNPDVANLAMRTRLILRLDVCAKHGCTANDMLIVAALSVDERIDPKTLAGAFVPKYQSSDSQITVDWKTFINDVVRNYGFNMGLIHNFAGQVQSLINAGYYVPDVDMNYIMSLK